MIPIKHYLYTVINMSDIDHAYGYAYPRYNIISILYYKN